MTQFITLERLILVVAFLYIVHLLWHKHKKRINSWCKDQKAKLPRHWKPKSSEDCHACCSQIQLSRAISRTVQPWSERKSTRGRTKNGKLVSTITRMVWGKRSELKELHKNLGLSDVIQTAFIERVNLTIRQNVSLLTRKTWSYAGTM